uniref:Uncharacterized protein n=1 Tax=Anguilla anguilla TaxID=7936 RepID=A0A0E9RRH2_ANGAN
MDTMPSHDRKTTPLTTPFLINFIILPLQLFLNITSKRFGTTFTHVSKCLPDVAKILLT